MRSSLLGTVVETPEGEFVITEPRHGTDDRGIFAGHERGTDQNVLFTINTPPREEAPPPRAHRTKGIARLRWCGAIGEHPGVLIEDEPPGEAIGRRRLPEAEALTYADDLLSILADADEPLGGLAAELIYGANGRVTELAPRAQPFIASGRPYCYGVLHLFTTKYLAPEVITAKPHDRAADVFAAGIILTYWLTGEDPFPGTSEVERLSAVMTNQRRPWRLGAKLGELVGHALATDPAARPTALELRQALSAFR